MLSEHIPYVGQDRSFAVQAAFFGGGLCALGVGLIISIHYFLMVGFCGLEPVETLAYCDEGMLIHGVSCLIPLLFCGLYIFRSNGKCSFVNVLAVLADGFAKVIAVGALIIGGNIIESDLDRLVIAGLDGVINASGVNIVLSGGLILFDIALLF